MRITVFGASGVLGAQVCDVAAARGHEVVGCSRSSGVELDSGRGVAAALEGSAVAVDATSIASTRRSAALRFFEATAATLQRAAASSGVDHVVAVSIVGIERMRQIGYYAGKLAQERRLLDGPVAASVLRATQFHELAEVLARRGSLGPVSLVPALRVQTVAARAVAELVVECCEAGPHGGRTADVGGPGPVASLPGLARAALAASGDRRRVVGVRLPGRLRRAVADGALLPAEDARLVGPTFGDWLASRAVARP